jgi:hypothetical protein
MISAREFGFSHCQIHDIIHQAQIKKGCDYADYDHVG